MLSGSSAPPASKARVQRVVVFVSLSVGVVCVFSSILKGWLSQPTSFDWFVAALGVLLCGMSLFSRFALTREGLEVDIREVAMARSDAAALFDKSVVLNIVDGSKDIGRQN